MTNIQSKDVVVERKTLEELLNKLIGAEHVHLAFRLKDGKFACGYIYRKDEEKFESFNYQERFTEKGLIEMFVGEDNDSKLFVNELSSFEAAIEDFLNFWTSTFEDFEYSLINGYVSKTEEIKSLQSGTLYFY